MASFDTKLTLPPTVELHMFSSFRGGGDGIVEKLCTLDVRKVHVGEAVGIGGQKSQRLEIVLNSIPEGLREPEPELPKNMTSVEKCLKALSEEPWFSMLMLAEAIEEDGDDKTAQGLRWMIDNRKLPDAREEYKTVQDCRIISLYWAWSGSPDSTQNPVVADARHFVLPDKAYRDAVVSRIVQLADESHEVHPIHFKTREEAILADAEAVGRRLF